MPTKHVNSIDIAYDTFGNADDRPLVLIMGLATSMIAWPEQFCRLLAKAGHYVIRFDNRDVGYSSKLNDLGVPDLEKMAADLRSGTNVQVPYTLSDMATDTIGLMDALRIERAHICGVSMGGMIGQVMAIEHPHRLRSLTSVMSTTGERYLPASTPAAVKAMMSMPPQTRDLFLEYQVDLIRAFSDNSDHFDEAVQRELADLAFVRGLYPSGFFRQMAAIMSADGRYSQLTSVRVPTLVLHGDRDTVIPLAHGQDTANAIAGARLVVVEGLGHGLAFPNLWSRMVAAIAAHTAEAESHPDAVAMGQSQG